MKTNVASIGISSPGTGSSTTARISRIVNVAVGKLLYEFAEMSSRRYVMNGEAELRGPLSREYRQCPWF